MPSLHGWTSNQQDHVTPFSISLITSCRCPTDHLCSFFEVGSCLGIFQFLKLCSLFSVRLQDFFLFTFLLFFLFFNTCFRWLTLTKNTVRNLSSVFGNSVAALWASLCLSAAPRIWYQDLFAYLLHPNFTSSVSSGSIAELVFLILCNS